MKLVIFRSDTAEEWSALYKDGKLEKVGESYLIDEHIQHLLGIETREGDFLLGGNYREDAAETIEEIEAYEQSKISAAVAAEAEALETQARLMMERAKALREGK